MKKYVFTPEDRELIQRYREATFSLADYDWRVDETSCCALSHISMDNNTSRELLVRHLLNKQQQAYFVVTTPGEKDLVKLLKGEGFVQGMKFPRHDEKGLLTLWTLVPNYKKVLSFAKKYLL